MHLSTSLVEPCIEKAIGKEREAIVDFIGLSQMTVDLEQKMICDGVLVTGPVPAVSADIGGSLCYYR